MSSSEKEQRLLEKLNKFLAKQNQQTIVEEKVVEEPPKPEIKQEVNLLEQAVNLLKSKKQITEAAPEYPVVPTVDKNLEVITNKIKNLEQWLAKVTSTGPGSGEVNFRYLDDVNRLTMTPGNNNWVLEYDANTKKVQFTEDIGPIQTVWFDPTHVDVRDDTGLLNWNQSDRTINIHHPNGVTQQVGQETYMLVKNDTGSVIPNGTAVRFDGASNGTDEPRITIAPFLADGTFPTLYTVGVTTEDIADGAEGFVTVFGKIRQLNTTGNSVGETWAIGNILYVHPTIAGALTNVKPTAPQNVIPIAAVVKVDSTEGELFVRPTIEQRYTYGRFSRTTDFTYTASDTAYPIEFNTTDISNGISLGNIASQIVVAQSGYYKISASVQLTTASNKGLCYLWLRKNGNNVINTTRTDFITSTDDTASFSYNIEISLDANDYIELYTAASTNSIFLNSIDATAFAPSTASVVLSITQEAL